MSCGERGGGGAFFRVRYMQVEGIPVWEALDWMVFGCSTDYCFFAFVVLVERAVAFLSVFGFWTVWAVFRVELFSVASGVLPISSGLFQRRI